MACLFLLFAAILLLSAQQMLARRGEPARSRALAGRRWATRLRLDSTLPGSRPRAATSRTACSACRSGMALMYGAGLISALLGIGSGVLKIPAHGHRAAPADQGLVRHVELHDRRDRGRQRRRLLRARRHRPGDRRTRRARLGRSARVLGARILMAVSSERLRLLFVVVLVALAGQMVLGAAGVDVVRGAA